MYCRRCRVYHFGGSRCPVCGDRMERGGTRFSRTGAPLAQGASPSPSSASAAPRRGEARRGGREVGKTDGLPLRIVYKAVDSIIGCALVVVVLRCALFLVTVAAELMRTGGEIESGISFLGDIRQGIRWFEYGGMALLTILVFIFRRNPR